MTSSIGLALLAGVFGWPEEPGGAVLDQMVKLLAIDRLVLRDATPEDAGYGYFTDIQVQPTTEALSEL